MLMDTIAFKRHNKAVASKSQSKQAPKSHVGSPSTKPGGIKAWMIVLIVLIIAATGIVIIRLSRASGGSTVPFLETEVASRITIAQTNPLTTTNTNGYVEFNYTPNTTQAVSLVGYYLDGNLVYTTETKPYTYILDTNRLANGSHTLTVVAFDANNQPLTATKRGLVVNNSTKILDSTRNVITYPWYWLLEL